MSDFARLFRLFFPALFFAALVGCAEQDLPGWLSPVQDPPSVDARGQITLPGDRNPVPVAGGQTAAAYDRVSSAERAAARQVAGGAVLGRTVASLGSPTKAGLWLKTPLVDRERQGSVRISDGGDALGVRLIPLEGPEGAGSQLSLSAMRALGQPLTALVEIEVRGAG